jgi:hypothetical protein
MVNKELLDYIRSVRNKGFDDSAIKANLLKYNYPEILISEAFNELSIQESPSKKEELPKIEPIKAAPAKPSSNAMSDPAWLLEEKTENTKPSAKSQETKESAIKGNNSKNKKTTRIILISVIILFILLGTVFLLYFTGNLDMPLSIIGVSSPDCSQVAIKIYEANSEPVLCIYPDNSKVQLILENSGNEIISSAQITLIGEKSRSTDNSDNLNLKPTDVLTRVLKYEPSTSENLKQMNILPIIEKNSIMQKCYSKKITYTQFKVC